MNKATIEKMARERAEKSATKRKTPTARTIPPEADFPPPVAVLPPGVELTPPDLKLSPETLQALIYANLVGGIAFDRTMETVSAACRTAYERSRVAVRVWLACLAKEER